MAQAMKHTRAQIYNLYFICIQFHVGYKYYMNQMAQSIEKKMQPN